MDSEDLPNKVKLYFHRYEDLINDFHKTLIKIKDRIEIRKNINSIKYS